LKKQPKLSEKERYNGNLKQKNAKKNKSKKNEPVYEHVDTETIDSGF